jgi:glycosyltransferase involved in cell wall biosynthesis
MEYERRFRQATSRRINNVYVSIIIPTRNRCESLRNTLVSLQQLNFPHDQYEIIVIDKPSTDDTRRVVEECNQLGRKEIIYYEELQDGLHKARHAGAQIAKGDILAYTDDDAICDPDWLSGLTRPYTDPKVGCVGGKVLPRFETKEPAWAKYFPGFLGILDRGSEIIKVNDAGIWGCNLSIRKTVLYDVGGFNPTGRASPMRYRGDDETGLLNKAIKKGYDVVYSPFAVVIHVIPQERVTIAYLKQRAFVQGVCDSYIEIRNDGGIALNESGFIDSAKNEFRRWSAYCTAAATGELRLPIYDAIVRNCYRKGVRYHRTEVSNDKKLLEYVLQPDYLDTELGQ